MIPIIFDVRLFCALVAAFILFTVAGTIAHESGHYLAARSFGYNPRINYRSTSYNPPSYYETIARAYGACIKQLRDGGKVECAELESILMEEGRKSTIITAAGPLQTIVTGTIGLAMLCGFRRRFHNTQTLKTWQWLLILITLFWLREVFNFVVAAWNAYLFDDPGRGDELMLSLIFKLHPLAIGFMTFLAGAIVFGVVFFRFVPVVQRLTFLGGGLAGGIVGYYLWFEHVGPLLLP